MAEHPLRAGFGDRGGDSLVDPSFEQRLIRAIHPIRDCFLAFSLHHLFDTGIFDVLASREDATVASLATTLDLEEDRLRGLLLYLANEEVVQVEDEHVRLTARGREYGEFRPWYTMMIGGYAETIGQMGRALARGSPSCTRNGRYVGLGSCEISRYDGMPMTKALLAGASIDCKAILDLGCGNGLYLVELCRQLEDVIAWGAEPDPGGFEEARRLVAAAGMNDRIHLTHASALEFLRNPPQRCSPDLIVFGYVLHEILAQEGEEAVVGLLRGVVENFPPIHIVVIEVANEIANPRVMRHGLAVGFWNPYFLLHSFTRQRLERRDYWERIFQRSGLELVGFTSTDPLVDSTGLEMGFLLRASSR